MTKIGEELNISISITWYGEDGLDLSEHEDTLREDALEQVKDAVSRGCTSGELHSMIVGEDDIEVSGWWSL